MTPINMFQAANILALGLYLLITIPDKTTPMAENTRPTVPEKKNIFFVQERVSYLKNECNIPVTKLE